MVACGRRGAARDLESDERGEDPPARRAARARSGVSCARHRVGPRRPGAAARASGSAAGSRASSARRSSSPRRASGPPPPASTTGSRSSRPTRRRFEPGRYDAALCLGASFVYGGLVPTLERLRAAAPLVAVGEPYWRVWPLPPNPFAGENERTDEGEWLPLLETVERFESTGVRVVSLIASSQDDWDRYEALHWQTLDAWLAANPDHPQADEFRRARSGGACSLPRLGARRDELGDLRLPHMSASPARRAAYEVLLRVFEQDAYADRAFRTAAEGLDERERAFAQRLAYGSVQRVRTIDYAIDELGKRPVREARSARACGASARRVPARLHRHGAARGRPRVGRARPARAARARRAVRERRLAARSPTGSGRCSTRCPTGR